MNVQSVAVAGVATQTAVAAPVAAAPTAVVAGPVAGQGGPVVTEETQAAVLAAATLRSMPDAATISMMQSLAGLPPAI